MAYYKREFKPSLFICLISVTLLVSLTVFHFSKVTILSKPRIRAPLGMSFQSQVNFSNESHDVQAITDFIKKKCSPVMNLFFLKTHKTASTTVQNIILRYAFKHNLTVALPVLSNSHTFSLTTKFNRKMVKDSPWGQNGFNILCHHLVYNQGEIEAIMPPDTIYFTIIRDPVSIFESYYEYINLKEKLKISLDEFAQVVKLKKGRKFREIRVGKYQNFLLKDFGINVSEDNPNFKTEIFSAIAKLDKRFDLVMLTERFDESVILLNQILCWETEDLISFTNNARDDKYRVKISNETSNILREWNSGDQIIYDFFRSKFERSLEEAKKKLNISKNVQKLQLMRSKMFDYCVEDKVPNSELKDFKFWTKKIMGYKLKNQNSTCKNLVTPERQLTSELRLKQLWRLLPPNIAKQFQTKMGKNKYGEINFTKRDLDMINHVFLANKNPLT